MFKPAILAIVFMITSSAVCPAQQTDAAAAKTETTEAIDRVLQLLTDTGQRETLVQQLKDLRETQADPAPAAPAQDADKGDQAAEQTADQTTDQAKGEAADQSAVLTNDGLLAAILDWASSLSRDLPRATFGVPIETKLDQAGRDLDRRLDDPGLVTQMLRFGLWAAAGWALVFAIGYLATRLLKTKSARLDDLLRTGLPDLKTMLLRLVVTLIPIALAFLASMLWPLASVLPDNQKLIAAVLPLPLLLAIAAARLASDGLLLLARTRGRRLVAYARRKIPAWLTVGIFIALMSPVSDSPPIRTAIGNSCSDILSLVLDLTAAGVAIAFSIRHRRTVRSLILKRNRVSKEPASFVGQSLSFLGESWQMLFYGLVIFTLVARLLGAKTDNFILQAGGSIVVVVVAVLLNASLQRAFELIFRNAAMRSRGSGSISLQFLRIAKGILHLALIFLASWICLLTWGFDVAGWMASEVGSAVIRPILSILGSAVFTWVMWILLDHFISVALMPTDAKGRSRDRSARLQTLLPLVRNFGFVTLATLTVIAALANLGINVAPLLAGAGVMGIAIGFGAQQLVQDVITGLFILIEDTIAIGDVIDTGDRRGTVEAMTIRTLRVRDADGALHSIPFSSLKAVKNSSRNFAVLTVSVDVPYASDVDEAIRVLYRLGRDLAADPLYGKRMISPIEVNGVETFNSDMVTITATIRTKPLQQASVRREFNRRWVDHLKSLSPKSPDPA